MKINEFVKEKKLELYNYFFEEGLENDRNADVYNIEKKYINNKYFK